MRNLFPLLLFGCVAAVGPVIERPPRSEGLLITKGVSRKWLADKRLAVFPLGSLPGSRAGDGLPERLQYVAEEAKGVLPELVSQLGHVSMLPRSVDDRIAHAYDATNQTKEGKRAYDKPERLAVRRLAWRPCDLMALIRRAQVLKPQTIRVLSAYFRSDVVVRTAIVNLEHVEERGEDRIELLLQIYSGQSGEILFSVRGKASRKGLEQSLLRKALVPALQKIPKE